MTSTAPASISVRQIIRSKEDPRARAWTVIEVDGGYLVKYGDTVLETINTRKPRLFRKLDSVVSALKVELGVTEFKVEALKMDA